MRRQLILLGLAVLSVLAVAACAGSPLLVQAPPDASSPSTQEQDTGQDAVVLTDQAGRQVTIRQPVQRVVSTYGMATLYAYALGAGDRLAAAGFLMGKDPQIMARLSQLQPDASKLPDPGGQQDANIEEIARANPDLILISARAAGQDTLEALGVPIVRYQGETMAKLKEAIALTGQALGPEAEARAGALVAAMDERLAAIRAIGDATPAGERKRVFISGTSPLKTAGKDMLQSEMIGLAGGVNVAQDIGGYWTEVNLEQVTAWDPQVIFVVPYRGASVEAILNSPEWANISAVKDQQVFMLPKYLGPWDTPIPEALLGIEWMAAKLFPDTSLRGGCEVRTTDFYQRFYDLAIPAEDAAELCR